MKKKTIIADYDTIDLSEITMKLWREKFLIIIITLIFLAGGYFFSIQQPKVYSTSITYRSPPDFLFVKLNKMLDFSNLDQTVLASNFNRDFIIILNSTDNLSKFIKKHEKFNEFSSELKKNNISLENYFQGFSAFSGKKNDNSIIQFTMEYTKPILPINFLESYIIYTNQIVKDLFKKQIRDMIKLQIQVYEQNLEIAEKINLENPILKSFAEGNSVVNEPSALFYKGSKVLAQQKLHLEKLFNELETFVYDYNPIYKKSSIVLISNNKMFLIASFILGLIFSFFFISIKSAFLK